MKAKGVVVTINMPGYLPEVEPYNLYFDEHDFDTVVEAILQEYLIFDHRTIFDINDSEENVKIRNEKYSDIESELKLIKKGKSSGFVDNLPGDKYVIEVSAFN